MGNSCLCSVIPGPWGAVLPRVCGCWGFWSWWRAVASKETLSSRPVLEVLTVVWSLLSQVFSAASLGGRCNLEVSASVCLETDSSVLNGGCVFFRLPLSLPTPPPPFIYPAPILPQFCSLRPDNKKLKVILQDHSLSSNLCL